MPKEEKSTADSAIDIAAGIAALVIALALQIWLNSRKQNKKSGSAANSASNETQQSSKVMLTETVCPERNPECKKKWHQKPNNWIKAATLFFVGGYTILTFCLVLTSRDTEHRQLRAYVGPQKSNGISTITAACQYCGIIDPAQQAKNNLTILVKNFGLTPAYRPTDCLLPIPVAVNEALDITSGVKMVEERCRSAVSRPTIWPQEERSYVSPFNEEHIELFRKATAKEIDLYVAGVITYDDAFGSSHKTYICYKYLLVDGLQNWESCDGVFGADD